MNVSQKIDDYIEKVGKGSIRDALNIALATIEHLESTAHQHCPACFLPTYACTCDDDEEAERDEDEFPF